MSEFVKALAKAQSEMRHAILDKVNPHFKSKYASLASVIDAAIPTLAANGFAVIQTTEVIDGALYEKTELAHASGEPSRFSYWPISPGNPQQQGSGFTYGRRYGLSGLACIASEEDDDGNAATKGHPLEGNKGLSENAPKAKSAHQARKDGIYPILEKEVRAILSLEDLRTWWLNRQDDIRSLPPQWIALIEEEKDRRKIELADELTASGDVTKQLKGSKALHVLEAGE